MNRRTIRETGKVPMWLLLMPALKEVAMAMAQGNGEPERGAFNWRENQVLRADMISGALRHITDAENGLEIDPKSRQRPLAHAIARLLILMDAEDHGMLIDTRVLQPKE